MKNGSFKLFKIIHIEIHIEKNYIINKEYGICSIQFTSEIEIPDKSQTKKVHK